MGKPILLSSSDNEKPGRRVQRTINGADPEPWIILDSVKPGEQVTVGIIITGVGEGTLVFTAEDISSITSGIAYEKEWEFSSVTETTYGFFPSGITAVKFKRTSGVIKGIVSV